MIEGGGWVEVATIVGGFATALAAAFAVIGIPLTYIQIKASKEIHREGIAKSLYREYLSDAVNRPELVQPDLAEIKRSGKFTQYELFVAHMLYSLEEILENVSGNGWDDVVRGQLKRHIDYLTSEGFTVKKKYYTKKLVGMIDALPPNT